jgi:hypothetical protein
MTSRRVSIGVSATPRRREVTHPFRRSSLLSALNPSPGHLANTFIKTVDSQPHYRVTVIQYLACERSERPACRECPLGWAAVGGSCGDLGLLAFGRA